MKSILPLTRKPLFNQFLYDQFASKKTKKYNRLYMDIAIRIGQMSYDERTQVGAVIVKEDRIISMGWNGMPSGFDNACKQVDGVTQPMLLHAESNAISKLAKTTESGDCATLYTTHAPCIHCVKLIIQSGIRKVYYEREYKIRDGIEELKKTNIPTIKI